MPNVVAVTAVYANEQLYPDATQGDFTQVAAPGVEIVSTSPGGKLLGIRPIHHQLEHRADAHILIAFLAYCLQITLKQRLLLHAPGLTPKAVLEKLAEIKMIDVWIPTVDQRWLILPRYTQPSPDTKLLIEKLKLKLPSQPPPRITELKEAQETNLQAVRSRLFVVKTFPYPRLIPKHLTGSEAPNCESSACLD